MKDQGSGSRGGPVGGMDGVGLEKNREDEGEREREREERLMVEGEDIGISD